MGPRHRMIQLGAGLIHARAIYGVAVYILSSLFSLAYVSGYTVGPVPAPLGDAGSWAEGVFDAFEGGGGTRVGYLRVLALAALLAAFEDDEPILLPWNGESDVKAQWGKLHGSRFQVKSSNSQVSGKCRALSFIGKIAVEMQMHYRAFNISQQGAGTQVQEHCEACHFR